MAQNPPYAQYPYYAQPQNIYQQLGKPQPQPHLQSAYQQQQLVHVPQQQQQYQYSYQQSQQSPIQRVPSAHGYQPPQTPFPNAPAYAPQQYQYVQAPTPAPQTPQPMYQPQRPPSSQNSRLPTSSFANLAPGQPIPGLLSRQTSQSPAVNASSGQLVPASQSLTLRGPSPAVSPRPPLAPSAMFAQQVQHQHQQQVQQQTPMSFGPATNRNSMVGLPQRQIMPSSQLQSQPPPQPQPQQHTQPQITYQLQAQTQPQTLPPPQPQQGKQIQQSSPQAGKVTPARRPLPSPGQPRTFPSINTSNSAMTTPISSTISNSSPARNSLINQPQLSLTTTPSSSSQPVSPVKTSSPTKTQTQAPSSPTKSHRPLPTPGGGGGGTSGSGGISGAGGNNNSWAREGFAGIGTKTNSSRVTGLPIDPSVSSLVAGIKPNSLYILPLPDGSSPSSEKDEEADTQQQINTGLPNPPLLIKPGSLTDGSGSGSVGKRRVASPPRFQPSNAGVGNATTSSPSSPIKGSPSPSASTSASNSSGHKLSPSTSSTTSGQPGLPTRNGQQPSSSTSTENSPTKPVWKRTIPEYPQPAFGYAAGMIKDPWAKSSPTSTSTTTKTTTTSSTSSGVQQKQKQSPNQQVPPSQTAVVAKPTQADLQRHHVERQLNAAMAHAHAKTQQQAQSGMPVSNTSYSAYAMYPSRSHPNLRRSGSRHVRSGTGVYDDEEEEEEEEDSEEDESGEDDEEEEDETGDTEEEREIRRRRKLHGKKPSESTMNGRKKKKKDVVDNKVKIREKGREKERKPINKKLKSAPRPASTSPTKRTQRRDMAYTSEDDTETTDLTPEEDEDPYQQRSTRHVKSSSASSSRFKAKVERERELLKLKKKRPQSQYDYPEGYHDESGEGEEEEDTPRKPRRRVSPPVSSQRQSYHPRNSSSGFLQRSSSPPLPPPRMSRRVSPPRVSLLKDAQRKTIKLRGGDDEDDLDDDRDSRGRREEEEMERWSVKEEERYRERERERARDDVDYREREREREGRYTSTSKPSSQSHYRGDRGDDEYGYDRIRQDEREIRYGSTTRGGNGGYNNAGGTTTSSGLPQPPIMARRRDAEPREDRWSKEVGRRDERERESNDKMFNLSRQDSPTRHPHPVRNSVFSSGYRNRPASPPARNNFPPQQQARSTGPLMSPYRSRPSSPTRSSDTRGSGELVSKFSGMNVKDGRGESRGGSGSRGGQGEWPVDLPRLPRTPGETPNAVAATGYFDIPTATTTNRDSHTQASSSSRASTEFARISERASAGHGNGNGNGNDSGSAVRGATRKNAHDPRHHSNLNMNLDDPPPRSLSPALSQGSSSYDYSDQTQYVNNHRAQNDVYTRAPAQRSKSFYGSTASSQEPPSPGRPRPQSQSYNKQVHSSSQSQPAPLRPRSIRPAERAELNTTKINNGTPKVQTINIESPAPVGGREKRADLDRMLSDPEDEDCRTPLPRISFDGGGGSQREDTPSSIGLGPMIQIESPRVPVIQVDEPRGPVIQVDEPRGPVIQIESPRAPAIQVDSRKGPAIQIDSPRGPAININSPQGPMINIEPSSSSQNTNASVAPKVQVYEMPGISIAGPEFDDNQTNSYSHPPPQQQARRQQARPRPAGQRGGLICGGCDGPIIGRIVSAMGARWHPQCFRCTVCNELLEHVSSFEHDGRPYCHLDYHENFAPRCFSCKTAIIEERFISLDDPALGKRTYHEQHFFCAECGDPFLAPSMNSSSRTGELNVQGDGEFESDDVGFTVYKGHPYCEACHVRLRLPKCKKCKRSIRDHDQAVEALGGKWCWGCFTCAGCEMPFENPSFFQRGDKPFCESCFDIMLRNEV